eukprot:1393519-Amorphochlora_amoeboformis.AAC.1
MEASCRTNGRRGRLRGGGFNVEFPSPGSINNTFSNITNSITQRATALALIGTLQNATWVDTLTKAVFVEFNAYNPTEDLLMIGTLFVEFPTSGGVVTSSNFDVFTDVRPQISLLFVNPNLYPNPDLNPNPNPDANPNANLDFFSHSSRTLNLKPEMGGPKALVPNLSEIITYILGFNLPV